MDESILAKTTIFNRIMQFINKIFSNEKISDEVKVYSKFKYLIAYMEKDEPSYQGANLAADICEKSLEMVQRKIFFTNKIKICDEKIHEMECFINLSNEDVDKLKNLLDSFISLTKERNTLIYELSAFDKTLSKLVELETEANFAVNEIQEAEKSYKILKQDISYLSGEKSALEFEKRDLIKYLSVVEKFTIAMVFLFSFATLSLGYLYMLNGVSLFVPTTVLILICIITIAFLHFYRDRINYAIKVNNLKQSKIIKLLNKKNVIYVYYTNFLKFEYKKFEIRNSQMLISNLKEYKNYKHTTSRIDAVRKIMYATEKELSEFIKERNINYKINISTFAKSVNVKDKIEFSRELLKDKDILLNNLIETEERQKSLWSDIEILKESDISKDKIISKLIQVYFNEAEKICSI